MGGWVSGCMDGHIGRYIDNIYKIKKLKHVKRKKNSKVTCK